MINRSSALFAVHHNFQKNFAKCLERVYILLYICGNNNKKTNFMTKQELITIASKKNFTIEFSKDRFGNEIIGVNKNNNCYHWFEMIGDNLLFNHTYSMNTGKSTKGTLHGLRILNSLNK